MNPIRLRKHTGISKSLYYTTVSFNFMNYYMQFICNKLPFNFVATYIIDSNSRTNEGDKT